MTELTTPLPDNPETADAAIPPEASRTIRRADYRPPEWRCRTVHLDFQLGLDVTEVTAEMLLERQGAGPIRLDVDGTLPTGLWLDGAEIRWRQEGDAILVDVPGTAQQVTLKVTSRVKPVSNTQLSGLYASNGMLCTQCEAEGFRRIVPFIDRPDNLSVYTVRMEGPRDAFPVLLANGERTDAGELEGGRHFAVWHDPWPKPSYLFALVAGDLVANRDRFTTMSGKQVDLAIYVRAGDEDLTQHAMDSLKRAMRWDEDAYGREYDLSQFNIVAVSDFNMGAMENKGLNIFNTRYILADPDTATDMDFDHVEGVVGHEYFHNWSGNRVTCRDWFQLSLKEGFTVYRDQSFSAAMGSPAVKRIEDVRVLRAAQFPEDAGPLAHPIRPDSYEEINNFYTATVYNKGAEVIRMMATLLGPERFRAGTDLYFARHDGEAATCEDFVRAMEEGGGIDLATFRRWYEQAGTPHVAVRMEQDAAAGSVTLHFTQSLAPTPGQPGKLPMPLPLNIALFDSARGAKVGEQLFVLDQAADSVRFTGLEGAPVVSLNRGFSAPVIINMARQDGDLAFLAAHEDDAFARYEAMQQLMTRAVLAGIANQTTPARPDHRTNPVRPELVEGPFFSSPTSQDQEQGFDKLSPNGGEGSHGGEDGFDTDLTLLITAARAILKPSNSDPAFAAEALMLPSEAFIGDQMATVDPDAIRSERKRLAAELGRALEADWRYWHSMAGRDAADLSPRAKGRRKLRGVALAMLMAADLPDAAAVAYAQYQSASGMTDRESALRALAGGRSTERDTAFADFYNRYQANPLVIDKWFQLQAMAPHEDTAERVEALAAHPDFTLANPNRVRALYAGFAANQASFHRADGKGYELLANLIAALDATNPQTAARMVPPLGRWQRFDKGRQTMMKAALERILATPNLSRDTREQAAKSLA